jgi:hypothetical protein
LIALPSIYAIVLLCGPWVIDPLKIYGGSIAQNSGRIIPGYSTIDPNIAYTSFALGSVAAKNLTALQLPLWNHLEGFGQPLLGETQSAALFPLTMLLVFPAGQVIAHVILQIIGGLGMFALVRNLGFGARTSFAIALAFEFSSLFVWLKNAMVNPIPFLLWLLVYTLRLVRSEPHHFSRIDIVGLGLSAGFAVLGGFPEMVLIFTFFLVAWTGFYFVSEPLNWPAAIALSKKLTIAMLIAFCVAAPALLALGVFAQEAHFGPHSDAGFRYAHLGSRALSKYIFPYMSGPIFGFPVIDEIGSIGGYTGVTLLVLAVAGAFAPGRTWERVFWSLTVAICIAISHGVRPLHGLAMDIPLLNITAFYRQSNVVWLIAMFLLAAHAIEMWPKIGIPRATVIVSVTALFIVLPLHVNWQWLVELAAASRVLPWILGSFIVGAVLIIILAIAWRSNRREMARVALATECIILFFIPTLSRPRKAVVDNALIEFLQSNLNQSRTVNFDHNVIQPNFGSYLSIAQLNFDDIPVPLATTQYIYTKLDPFYPKTPLYLPDYPMDDRHESRSRYMVDHAVNYGDAGVKYILSPRNSLSTKSAVASSGQVAHAIHDNEEISFKAAFLSNGISSRGALGVQLATYGGTTDGEVEITTCRSKESCETQLVAAQSIEDNAIFVIKRNVQINAKTEFQITLRKIGGRIPLAIWLYPEVSVSEKQISVTDLAGVDPAQSAFIPKFVFTIDSLPNLKLVHSSFGGDVFEISPVRPYLSGPNCAVTTISFDEATAVCSAPSVLTRLEIWQTGWSAVINGHVATVESSGPFQQIAAPAGELVISFDYNPFGLRYVCEFALLAMFGFSALFLSDCWRRTRANRRWSQFATSIRLEE